MNQNITAMTQITFHSIINTALLKANDRGNLKSYIIRQSKIAERDAFYTWDDFSAGLIKDVTGKMELIKFLHKKRLEGLQQDIDNIEKISFKDPSGDKNLNDYTSEEREQYQITARKKHLDWTKEELKSLTVYHYNKNEYGKLEIIIDVINEISGRDKANVSDEPQRKPTAKHHALAYILDCDANGRNRLEGQKKRLEKIGKKRSGKSGNTFYKACNELQGIDINSGRTISAWLGDDWANIKSIILDLSEDRKTLIEYFEKKQL